MKGFFDNFKAGSSDYHTLVDIDDMDEVVEDKGKGSVNVKIS